ncbi:hypothetical protein ACIHFC_14075 [Streptomyces sp. NPDC052013]|uniref:hypothetical protein n=1 Tax=unclassified Streptomyces TaxID=2593676 RepID=UPI00344F9CAB
MTHTWVPWWMRGSVDEVRTLPAGQWWDAVRVPLAVGTEALRNLGSETGAVIEDGFGGILYWLVVPGSAADWRLPRVRVLGRGSHVAVPPPHRVDGPGLHWRVPPAHGRDTTVAPRLHTALLDAMSPTPDPPAPTDPEPGRGGHSPHEVA